MKRRALKKGRGTIEEDRLRIYFFLGAAFLAAGFLAAGFLAAGFLAALGFLAAAFLAAGFLAGGFLAAFLAAGFLATFFLAAGSLAASLKDPAPFFPAAAAATRALESTIFLRAILVLDTALAASTL